MIPDVREDVSGRIVRGRALISGICYPIQKPVMIKTISLLLALCWATAALSQTSGSAWSPRQIGVAFHPNVELLGFVYFLGYEGAQSETDGYSERNRKRYAYGIDLYRRYRSFAGSKNLAIAVSYAENIWLDYFISLLIQLDDFPNAQLPAGLDIAYYQRFSPTGDPAEARKNATAFLDAMNALHREVNFGTYLAQSRKLYAHALAQVEAGLPEAGFLPAVEAFYQDRFDSYQLVPSLTIPAGMGFGARYASHGKRYAFHVFGTFAPPQWADSSTIDMGFHDEKHLLELSTHEFGHSFVNPVVDRLPGDAITETSSLFAPIGEAMADQGYTGWKACIYEHFVRAGEVLIARNLGHDADAERLRKHYIDDRKFIYLDILLDELGRYHAKQTSTYEQAVSKAMQRLHERVK